MTGGASVAVIIPTYNRSAYLAQALDSALRQSRSPDEVLVVDDGSTDDTAAVCDRRPGVRRLHQLNQGQGAARNTGLVTTRCEWVRFLDDDDLLEPGALEQEMEILGHQTETDLLYSRTLRIDATGEALGEDLVHHRQPADPLAALLQENFIRIQAVMARRTALMAVGSFDPEMVPCEDYDLWLRLAAAKRRFLFSHHIGARYRVHEGSVSRDSERMARTLLRATQKHEADRPGCSASAHYRLGRVLLEGGRNHEAAVEFGAALAGQPRSLRYRLYRMVARHPGFQRAGMRYAQQAKRGFSAILTRLGWREQRWGHEQRRRTGG